MAVPTIANFFGANAVTLTAASTAVVASAAAPVLVIRYADFAAQDWNALAAGNETDPEKWITAILRKIYDFSLSNTDEIPNVVVTAPILGLETRNAVAKRRFSYGVDVYINDTGTLFPDPDSV